MAQGVEHKTVMIGLNKWAKQRYAHVHGHKRETRSTACGAPRFPRGFGVGWGAESDATSSVAAA